jgi:acyl-[acyl carrier protein]--UDP-N-acetylglucosamine O-acyltransferase
MFEVWRLILYAEIGGDNQKWRFWGRYSRLIIGIAGNTLFLL